MHAHQLHQLHQVADIHRESRPLRHDAPRMCTRIAQGGTTPPRPPPRPPPSRPATRPQPRLVRGRRGGARARAGHTLPPDGCRAGCRWGMGSRHQKEHGGGAAKVRACVSGRVLSKEGCKGLLVARGPLQGGGPLSCVCESRRFGSSGRRRGSLPSTVVGVGGTVLRLAPGAEAQCVNTQASAAQAHHGGRKADKRHAGNNGESCCAARRRRAWRSSNGPPQTTLCGCGAR